MQLKELSRERGFLPSCDPLTKLNTHFGLWEGMAKELPKFLVSDRLRTLLDQMPVLDVDRLDQDAEDSMEEAIRFADESPMPEPAQLYADVYVDYPLDMMKRGANMEI